MALCLVLGLFITMQLGSQTFVAAISAQQKADIDQYVNEIMSCRELVGMGLAVVQDQDRYTRGYGFADIEENIEVDEDTMFGIASISKSFLTRAWAEVIAENAGSDSVGWYSLVRDLNPDVKFSDEARNADLRLRDLLCMRSGIPEYLAPGAFDSIPDFLSRVKCSKAVMGLRDSACYVDDNYSLAGNLLNTITGKGFATLMRELILDPLGMDKTSPSWADFGCPQYGQYAQGYWRLSDGTIQKGNSNSNLDDNNCFANKTQDWLEVQENVIGPYEGFSTNPKDIAKYMRHILDYYAGDGNDPRFSPDLKRHLQDNFTPCMPFNFNTSYAMIDGLYGVADTWRIFDYGQGWWIGKYRDTDIIQHGGLQFHHSMITLFKDWNLAVFTATNGIANNNIKDGFQNTYTGMTMMHFYIADLLRGNVPLTQNVTFACDYLASFVGASSCGPYDIYPSYPDPPDNISPARPLNQYTDTYAKQGEVVAIERSLVNPTALTMTKGCETYELWPTEQSDVFAAVATSTRECYGCAEKVAFTDKSGGGNGPFTYMIIDDAAQFTNTRKLE